MTGVTARGKPAIRPLREYSSPHLVLVTRIHILSAVRAPVGANSIFCDFHPSVLALALTGAHKCPIKKSPRLLPLQHLLPPSAPLRFRRDGAQVIAELM